VPLVPGGWCHGSIHGGAENQARGRRMWRIAGRRHEARQIRALPLDSSPRGVQCSRPFPLLDIFTKPLPLKTGRVSTPDAITQRRGRCLVTSIKYGLRRDDHGARCLVGAVETTALDILRRPLHTESSGDHRPDRRHRVAAGRSLAILKPSAGATTELKAIGDEMRHQ